MSEIQLEDIRPGDRIRMTSVFPPQDYTETKEFVVDSVKDEGDGYGHFVCRMRDGKVAGRVNFNPDTEAGYHTFELISRPEYQPQNGDLFGNQSDEYLYWNGWLIHTPDQESIFYLKRGKVDLFAYDLQKQNVKLIKRADGEPV